MHDDFDLAVAFSGLEMEQRSLRLRVDALVRQAREVEGALRDQEALAEKLREALGEHMPPFKVGQHVKVKANGGTFIVEAVERAFGQWLVQGHFPQGYKTYTYPASELEEAN